MTPTAQPAPSPAAVADAAGRPLATWRTRLVWLLAIAVGVAGVLLTAVGSAIGQVVQADDASAVWILAAAVALSALVGIGWMLLSRRPLAHYGVRAPAAWRSVLWALPLLVVPAIVLLTTGIAVASAVVAQGRSWG